jgi:hypothetical protein
LTTNGLCLYFIDGTLLGFGGGGLIKSLSEFADGSLPGGGVRNLFLPFCTTVYPQFLVGLLRLIVSKIFRKLCYRIIIREREVNLC